MQKQVYKTCSTCFLDWKSFDDFLSDPEISVSGYQMNIIHLEKGLILFNHTACGTTISEPVNKFTHLYDGPRYTEKLIGSEACPSYCLAKDETKPCSAHCECAYVREIMQILMNWKKRENKNRKSRKTMNDDKDIGFGISS